ncbi:MAG: hypothetical protein WCW27_06275 [Patescibacteria group bacterium]|jgi:hypothetical protein
MNKKTLIILSTIAGILLIGIIVLLVVIKRQPTTNTNSNNNPAVINANNSVTNNAVNNSNTTTTNTANTVTNVPLDNKTSIYNTARFFTERYGSFSTTTGQENIISLQAFMTENMKSVVANNINNSTNTANSNSAYTVITTAVNIELVDYDEAATGATVEVSTRRVETIAGATKQFSQTARLQLKKTNQTWQVDTFKWLNNK